MKNLKLLLTTAVISFAAMLCCSMSAFALTDGDWEFQILDNEIEITGYLGEGGDVIIPETIYGCPVTKVYLTEYGKTLDAAVSIEFPGSVKVIERVTYSDNNTIKKVILSEGTEKIGNYAFQSCKALESINFPSTLKVISNGAFRFCEKLDNLTFPSALEEIQSGAFGTSGLREVNLNKTSATIKDKVFENCYNLKKVRLPENITEISEALFLGCSALNDIEIPATVETIGSYSFGYCKSLENVVLPVSLKEIKKHGAFEGCDLKEVVIPYGTKTIGGSSFSNCSNLKSVYIPDTVTNMSFDIIKNSPNAIIYCSTDSYTAEYCKKEKISYLTDNSVNSGIHVLYNGTRISFHSYGQNPELLESRTLVPLRSIFEAMGADVEWDGATSTAIAKRGGVEIKIQIGANEMYKDGKAISVDVPAMLLNSRTMVPVRVIAEAFGASVQWNANGRTVLITE